MGNTDRGANFLFALYVFAMDYHGGQWTRLYRIGSRLGGGRYRVRCGPGPTDRERCLCVN